jgi:transposase
MTGPRWPGSSSCSRPGITWNQLPTALVGCSGVTCWRRLREWTEAGLWPSLQEQPLAQPRARRAGPGSVPGRGSHIRALKGGATSARPRRPRPARLQAPRDLRRRRHPARSHPHPCNRNDVTQLIPLVDAVPPIRGLRGRPRRRPRELFADRGDDHDLHPRQLRQRGITPRIARRGLAHGSGLGKKRWVVERGFAWLHAFKLRFPRDRGGIVYKG